MPVATSQRAISGLLATALALTMLGATGPANPVAAYAGSCYPGRNHDNNAHQAHTNGTPGGLNGISSSILELDPYYSGSNDTGTNSSVMLDRYSAQWAQLGWAKVKFANGVSITRNTFLEFYLDGAHNYFRFWSGRQVQTSTWYEILYESPSTYNFFVAGTLYATYTGSFTPVDYEVFSETHDLADQMPGTPDNVEVFNGTTYFTGPGHSGHYTTSGISSEPYYGVQHPAAGQYYVWDLCPSGYAPTSSSPVFNETTGASVAQTPALLEPSDYQYVGVTTAQDVTTVSAFVSGSKVSRDAALSIAAGSIGTGSSPQVLWGTASRFPTLLAQPVWIVTTPGGTPPSSGPLGGPGVLPAGLTGVIIDATTGEVWSGFMR